MLQCDLHFVPSNIGLRSLWSCIQPPIEEVIINRIRLNILGIRRIAVRQVYRDIVDNNNAHCETGRDCICKADLSHVVSLRLPHVYLEILRQCQRCQYWELSCLAVQSSYNST